MPSPRIAIAPSMTLAIVLGVSHLAAAGLLWLVPIPALGKAMFTFGIGGSLIYFMARNALLHSAHSVVALEFRDGADAVVRTRRGEWIECELLASSYLSPRLTILNLRPRGRWAARHVILMSDNVDPREFRRLRIWLRWKRGDERAPAPIEER